VTRGGTAAGAAEGAIPAAEVARFLAGLPEVRLFPGHPEARVRAIALSDVYRAALRGLDWLVGTLERHGIADHLMAVLVDLETSLHPFLSRNRHLRARLSRLVRATVVELEADPEALEPDGWDLYLLGALRLAAGQLPAAERRGPERLLGTVRRRLRAAAPLRAEDVTPPVTQGASLGDCPQERWEAWLHAVVEARYAHALGAPVDLEAVYRRAAEEVMAVPFAPGHAVELVNVMSHVAYGMSFYNRRPLAGEPLAERLADHGLAYLDWLAEHDLYADDPEILGAFLDAFLKGTARSYDSTPWFGAIVALLLETQRDDGGWGVQAAGEDLDAEELYALYHPTWVCVDALRPLKIELASARNRALGLV
jgi:hypothetical protein